MIIRRRRCIDILCGDSCARGATAPMDAAGAGRGGGDRPRSSEQIVDLAHTWAERGDEPAAAGFMAELNVHQKQWGCLRSVPRYTLFLYYHIDSDQYWGGAVLSLPAAEQPAVDSVQSRHDRGRRDWQHHRSAAP